jgi:hypothetical protein
MITRRESGSTDDLNGLDDARAYQALQRWHAPYDSVADWTQRACLRCQQIGVIVGDGLCAGCHADRQWTLVNRALCDLVHRGVPGHLEDGSRFRSRITELAASVREAASSAA